MRKYKVTVTSEQEVTMTIIADNKNQVKETIKNYSSDNSGWQDELEDEEDDKPNSEATVQISATKGFKTKSQSWKIKTIKAI